jgi:signal transduction histidine kinase
MALNKNLVSVIKEVVTLHNGDVQVDSVEGVGSMFTIRLPLRVEVEIADA